MPVETPAVFAATIAYRPYRDGDEAAILDLFARTFHVERSLAHFDWKYRADPFGSRHISLALDSEERLVAHYAGYVVPFTDAGRSVLAHQVGDTMTEVAVRHVGRGPSSVLGRTARHFYGTFCESRVAFNYGFNTANIQKFSIRFLGSDAVEPVAYVTRDLARRPMRRLSRVERLARGYTLELATAASAEWDELFERVAPEYGFLVSRTAQYVDWRYFQCPDVRYIVVAIRKRGTLAGWSVFRIRGESLLWVDALFDPRLPEAASILLRHVTRQFPVTRVEGWFPPRPAWFARVLHECGFERMVEPQELSLMCVPFGYADATERMRRSLYYTMGDSDLA